MIDWQYVTLYCYNIAFISQNYGLICCIMTHIKLFIRDYGGFVEVQETQIEHLEETLKLNTVNWYHSSSFYLVLTPIEFPWVPQTHVNSLTMSSQYDIKDNPIQSARLWKLTSEINKHEPIIIARVIFFFFFTIAIYHRVVQANNWTLEKMARVSKILMNFDIRTNYLGLL